MTNHWMKYMLGLATLLVTPQVVAQTVHCKDSLEHRRLRSAMWATCQQDNPSVVYAACWAYQAHAIEDKDNEAYYDSWTCGIMFNLDRMNIHDARKNNIWRQRCWATFTTLVEIYQEP